MRAVGGGARLAAGRLRFEIQIETPQAVLGADGTATVARLIHAAAGRCTGLHYGTYDYSAALRDRGRVQSMEHPVADYAKAVMQVAAAGTGVRLSDGSTNVLPVGDTDAGARGLGAARPAGAPVPGARLLPGLGPAPGAAADPVSRRRTRFYRDGPRAPAAVGPAPRGYLDAAGRPASWTSRRRPARWPASCCAAWTAARSTRPRSGCR